CDCFGFLAERGGGWKESRGLSPARPYLRPQFALALLEWRIVEGRRRGAGEPVCEWHADGGWVQLRVRHTADELSRGWDGPGALEEAGERIGAARSGDEKHVRDEGEHENGRCLPGAQWPPGGRAVGGACRVDEAASIRSRTRNGSAAGRGCGGRPERRRVASRQ